MRCMSVRRLWPPPLSPPAGDFSSASALPAGPSPPSLLRIALPFAGVPGSEAPPLVLSVDRRLKVACIA